MTLTSFLDLYPADASSCEKIGPILLGKVFQNKSENKNVIDKSSYSNFLPLDKLVRKILMIFDVKK